MSAQSADNVRPKGAPPDGLRTARPTPAYLERRARILAAAGEVFYEQSYHAASMHDIAERAGMLKPNLYHYFESKEDVLFELVAGERSAAMIEAFYDVDAGLRDRDGATRLQGFVTCWIKSAGERTPSFIAAEREFRQLSPARYQKAVALRRRVPSLLESILHAGVRDGSFDAEINIPVAAKNISTILTDFYVWYNVGGPSTLDELTRWHITFILRGLGARTEE